MGMLKDTTKEVPKTPAQLRKWKSGSLYRCILSKSPGYKVGKFYRCYTNHNGNMCLCGDDDLEDIVHMLVSGFVEVDEEKANTRYEND